MALRITKASLATVDELFAFRSEGFVLPPFPGYHPDDPQWGIKAHNRPWVAAQGHWAEGDRVIELGGAYSRLPEWLGTTYGVEPWIGDDFGEAAGDDQFWSRWGEPRDLPEKYPAVNYQFENFSPGSSYRDAYFDCVFSISTLEHVPPDLRVAVLKEVHRTLKPGGREIHAIDVTVPSPKKAIAAALVERTPARRLIAERFSGSLAAWWSAFANSGVDTSRVRMPSTLQLLHRATLVESPDVVYRFFPPQDAPTPYEPAASLLVVIEDV